MITVEFKNLPRPRVVVQDGKRNIHFSRECSDAEMGQDIPTVIANVRKQFPVWNKYRDFNG